MQLPPSSPVKAIEQKPNPFYQPSSEADYHRFQLKPIPNTHNEYPTPFPSSSAGRSSSPVRQQHNEIHDSPPLATSPPRIDTSAKSISSPLSDDDIPVYKPPVEAPVAIKLIQDRVMPLVIGRKSSCDVVLPNRTKISRKHAMVTYLSSSRQVKLKCLGSNGLVVLLPKSHKCKLVRLSHQEKNVVKDTDSKEYALVEDPACIIPYKNDKIVVDVELTSFTLLKNESVIMPYIQGTIIDFRDAEGVLSIRKNKKRHSYLVHKSAFKLQNSSGSELTEFSSTSGSPLRNLVVSNKNSPPSLHNFGNSEPYGIMSGKFTTPNNSGSSNVSQLSPTTPMKIPHSAIKASSQQTPTIVHNYNKIKRPLGESAQNKRSHESAQDVKISQESSLKQKKLKKEQKRLTQEELLQQMKAKNVNIQDLTNVLINHLAFANVQQTPLFQLQKVSSKTVELSRSELRALLGSIDCIGIIYRQGKDAAGKPLDEEYFYDLENDNDSDRRTLVTSLKGGRSGLRSCRKTHKQYFWKKPAK
uniref:TOS4 n=1 Tax=Nakaseomyces delphensis TaxID=51657 RepID=Q874M7_NAKDE|nr:TOS4 [Nakaseomyces delphensis]